MRRRMNQSYPFTRGFSLAVRQICVMVTLKITDAQIKANLEKIKRKELYFEFRAEIFNLVNWYSLTLNFCIDRKEYKNTIQKNFN